MNVIIVFIVISEDAAFGEVSKQQGILVFENALKF